VVYRRASCAPRGPVKNPQFSTLIPARTKVAGTWSIKYFSWSDCWSWLARDRSISWTSSTMTRLVFRSVVSWHAWWVSAVSFVLGGVRCAEEVKQLGDAIRQVK
jgi:hypothetical protein